MGRKVEMLSFLKVKDFAIIEELGIDFEEGLNVVTGETGAGKSIIINALSTLMSAKVSPEMIRSDARQAEVIGHFLSSNEELILKRVINLSGRSKAFLNDDPIVMARLEEIGYRLINIYGQNEFQHLLDRDRYIEMIDRMLSLDNLRHSLALKVRELKDVTSLLNIKLKELEGRDKEIALLEFQIEEIEREAATLNEEEGLKDRLKVLKESERINRLLTAINESLYERDDSFYVMMKRFLASLRPLSSIKELNRLYEKMDSLTFSIEDLIADIKGIDKGLEHDFDEQKRIEDRLSRIYILKEKYGGDREGVMMFLERAKKRYEYLTTLSTEVDRLEEKRRTIEDAVKTIASRLSTERRMGAQRIEEAILKELDYLSMKGMNFKIAIADKGLIDEEGMDDIELLICTNSGEQLKPLRKIASGGELSRIMLAIKRVTGGDEEKTLIFDEIDAGIGGRVADVVGKRLKTLAKDHQVICITHLPQIAVYGDSHYLVEKYQTSSRTKTMIRRLSETERVHEIARMLGGETITELTFEQAREMLENAKKGLN